MSQGAAIALDGVSFRRGKRDVVRGVRLEVSPGQIVVLVGPNGSGKTSLLRGLAGLERPSAGRVMVAGHDLSRGAVRVRLATGYVPEVPAFDSELSVQEQLTLHSRLAGLGPSEARATVASMLELLDLFAVRGRLPDTLSRGQRQRLAIGRALVHDPSILLLDEPLVALDTVGQMELTEVLEELRELGKTVVVASCLPGALLEIADAVYAISDGELAPAGASTGAGYARLRLAVLGDGEGVLTRLSELDDVREVSLESQSDAGTSRLNVLLKSSEPAAVARVIRSVVESGASVVEAFSEVEEVPVG